MTELHDMVDHPSHYNDPRFRHAPCGKPIEVIDITRRLDFCRGNAVKYILRAGLKDNELEDLRKAARYLGYVIEELEAEQETAEILGDPETMAAIEEGDRDKLEGRETAEHSMQLDLEQDDAHWPDGSQISVEYPPMHNPYAFSRSMYSEYATGQETAGDFKKHMFSQLGYGNSDAYTLWVGDLPIDDSRVLADVALPGYVLRLKGIPAFPDTSKGHFYKADIKPDDYSPAAEGDACGIIDGRSCGATYDGCGYYAGCRAFVDSSLPSSKGELGDSAGTNTRCGSWSTCFVNPDCRNFRQCSLERAVANPDRTQAA